MGEGSQRERGRRRERERNRKTGWMGVRRSWWGGGGGGGGGGRGGREGRKGGMGRGQPGIFVCTPFEGRERRRVSKAQVYN